METKESSLLERIRNGLNSLWSALDYYNSNNQLDDYSAPIIQAVKPVESMIILLAYENGYDYDGVFFSSKNDASQYRGGAAGPLGAACHGELSYMFGDVAPILHRIRKTRNHAVHMPSTSYEDLVLFSAAFDSFVSWFILKSSTLRSADASVVSSMFSSAKSMNNRIALQITESSNTNNEAIEFRLSSSIPDAKRTIIEINNTSEDNSRLLEAISAQNEKIDKLCELQEKNNKGLLRIEIKVDQIADTLEDLSRRIEGYQSLIERQIDLAVTESEIDRIINAYADECTTRIVREVNSASSSKTYEAEKEKLIHSLGDSAWNKLDPSSQNFLITAKVTFNHLITINNSIDYSGVCLLVTKAIEVEMSNRFCRDYLTYLKATYPGKANYCEYPTMLLNKYEKPIRPKDFTLGSVAYVLCYNISEDLSEDQINKNHDRLIEFVSKKLMAGIDIKIIEQRLEMIAQGVEDVRRDYRNPSAHTNKLQSINAKQCFDLVLDVEKLLKAILDALDY